MQTWAFASVMPRGDESYFGSAAKGYCYEGLCWL